MRRWNGMSGAGDVFPYVVQDYAVIGPGGGVLNFPIADHAIDPTTGLPYGYVQNGVSNTPQPPPPPPPPCPPGSYNVNGQPCGGGVYPPPQPLPPVQPLPPRNPVYTFAFPQQPVYIQQPQPQSQLVAGISNTTLLIGAGLVLLLIAKK
jgi:hypothetical protein